VNCTLTTKLRAIQLRCRNIRLFASVTSTIKIDTIIVILLIGSNYIFWKPKGMLPSSIQNKDFANSFVVVVFVVVCLFVCLLVFFVITCIFFS